MKSKSSAPPTRFLGLDFLRGFGAIGVVVGHSTMGALFMSTYLAVDFFLVLSGFVLTKAYFDKPSLDLPKLAQVPVPTLPLDHGLTQSPMGPAGNTLLPTGII